MRYAVLSDIHSNLVALESVLGELADAEIDRYLCLGDLVGYGARPNQCCDLIRQLDAVSVRGNHDEAAVDPSKAEWFTAPARACIIWTNKQLRSDNLEYLANLPSIETLNDMTLCHGSIPDPGHYTVTPGDALLSFEAMSTSITFFGHTHYAEWFAESSDGELPAEYPIPSGGELCTEDGWRYLVNPGAVGQPRDGNEMAAYAIYDSETGEIELRRVQYEIEKTALQMKEAGLPESMYTRLWLGV